MQIFSIHFSARILHLVYIKYVLKARFQDICDVNRRLNLRKWKLNVSFRGDFFLFFKRLMLSGSMIVSKYLYSLKQFYDNIAVLCNMFYNADFPHNSLAHDTKQTQ